MAIYHLHSSIITRSKGRSAVAAAAYIASDALYDKRQNLSHDYSRKSNVYASNILAPDNAPNWAKNTENLWNAAEEFEDELANLRYRGFEDEAKNAKSMAAKEAYINSAQIASTFEGSLPIELSKEKCVELVEEFLKDRFVSRGLVSQYAIHWEKGNPHFHAMITRRAISGNNFSRTKDRDIVSREALKETRKLYAEISNKYLEKEGFETRIDHRSFKNMGLEIEPTRHKGWKASNLELTGEYSRISKENEQIRINNIEILFQDPSQIIKQIALKKTVFTKEDVANEIIKRVGADNVLFEILQEKVNEIKIPNSISPALANDNKIFYEWIKNIEEQEKYYALLDENASIYAEEILIEEQEAVLIGSNMRDKPIYAAKESIEQEKKIFDLAAKINARNNVILASSKIDHFCQIKEQESRFKLNIEQKEAIHYLCSGSNIRNLIGRAGTGKTTLLKVVADSYKDAGYKVIGTSFQGKTIELMAKEIGIKTNTLDSYRIAWQKYENLKSKIENNELSGSALTYAENTIKKIEQQGKILNDKTVVIVDEANMIAQHLWEPLITQVEKSGAKLLTVQDPAQIKPHTAGDIARGLLDQYSAYELKSILRQRIFWQKECSQKLNDHNLREGLAPYLDKGNVCWYRDEMHCYNKIVEDYVSGIIDQNQMKLSKSHLFMSFLNSKVNSVNIMIHNRLKEQELLTNHIIINNKEYSVNERIVFTERNENIGNKVRTISDHPEKGVKNGTFGTIIAIDEGKLLKKTSFTVKLDDDRIVKFHPEEYSHFSYGYGITINKAEGLTCDYSYLLFDQKMNANLTLIGMTRHKQDVKGYLLESDFTDFKDLVGKIGGSQQKELISDYTITPDVKPYYDKVKQYKESVILVSTLLAKGPETVTEWQKVKDNTEQRNNLAKEILENYQSHSLFVNQANIRKENIKIHAGVKQRLLSDLEIKARITVERYSSLAKDTRNLWNEIKQTHPARMAKSHAKYDDYNNLREDRDSLASVIAESKKLYGQFFKENNIRWQAIETQNKYHYDRQLHNAFVSRLNKEEKEAYNIVKSYIDAKNNVIGFVAHFKDKSQEQSQNKKMAEARIYNFPDKQEYQLFKQEKITRDNLALKLVENHQIYEKYWSVLKVNTDTLLEHAIKGEEKLKRQEPTKDNVVSVGTNNKGKQKYSYDNRFENKQQHYNHVGYAKIREQANANAKDIAIHLLGNPNKSLSTNNELRYGKKGSMSIKISGPNQGMWRDFESDQGGDVIALIKRERHLDNKEVFNYASSLLGLGDTAFNISPNNKINKTKEEYTKAKSHHQNDNVKHDSKSQIKINNKVIELYHSSQAIEGSVAEHYLKIHRNIVGALPKDLRFIENAYDPVTKTNQAALASFARNSSGEVSAVQLTYLDKNNNNKLKINEQPHGCVKRSFGNIKGTFVEIQKNVKNADSNQNHPIYVAEGVETALSIKEAGIKGAIVASLGVYNIKNISTLTEAISSKDLSLGAQQIIICADNDGVLAPTNKTIEKAYQLLTETGYKVRVIKPDQEGQDFNDVLRKNGKESLIKAIETITIADNAILQAQEQDQRQNQEQSLELATEIVRRNEILPDRGYLSFTKAIASDMYYQKQISQEVNLALKQVYKDPEMAKENWQKLELKDGFAKAISIVRANPEIIGQIKGSNIIGFKNEDRKQADMNKFAIHAIFGIYSEALKAQNTRQEVENYSQSKVQKELSIIDTKQNYDQLLEQLTKINTKLIPGLENKVTNYVLEIASSRMMEYIIDHKIRYNQEPNLNEMKSFFYRSKFEAIRFKQLSDRISKDQSVQDYLKQAHLINRQVNIEGRLFAKEFVENAYKQPLKIDYHNGNITYNFNQYKTEAAKELTNNNKELPLFAKMIENSYVENTFTESRAQDMAVLLTEYKEKFDSMPNALQQACIKNIVCHQAKPDNVNNSNVNININYLHIKEIGEIYNRTLWHSTQNQSFKLENVDRNRDDYKQIEEKSKAHSQTEYSLTKFELDKEAKQAQLDQEKQLGKEIVKEIGER